MFSLLYGLEVHYKSHLWDSFLYPIEMWGPVTAPCAVTPEVGVQGLFSPPVCASLFLLHSIFPRLVFLRYACLLNKVVLLLYFTDLRIHNLCRKPIPL